jgi:quercetin dioxygenase-like cupin family protein
MKVTALKDAERVPIQIDARKMCVRQDVELIHLRLASGEILERHSNPFDVVFYLLEGEGELEVEGEKRQLTKDVAIEVPAGAMRGWKSSGEGDLRVLVLKILKR